MGPSFLAATFPFSSPEEYSFAEFSVRSLPEMFPYSLLFGTTVVTRCVSLRSLFGNRDRYAQCKKLCPVLVSARSHLFPMRKWPRLSFPTALWLVLPGTMHLALCCHFTVYFIRLSRSSASWSIWTGSLGPARGDPTGAVLGQV